MKEYVKYSIHTWIKNTPGSMILSAGVGRVD